MRAENARRGIDFSFWVPLAVRYVLRIGRICRHILPVKARAWSRHIFTRLAHSIAFLVSGRFCGQTEVVSFQCYVAFEELAFLVRRLYVRSGRVEKHEHDRLTCSYRSIRIEFSTIRSAAHVLLFRIQKQTEQLLTSVTPRRWLARSASIH